MQLRPAQPVAFALLCAVSAHAQLLPAPDERPRVRFERLGGRSMPHAGAPLPGYSAATIFDFAQPAQLFPCATSISGRFDVDCGGQCLVWADGGVNCYDNAGAAVGTMTQPTGGLTTSASNMMLPDGGWLQQWEFPDDTSGVSHLAQLDSSAFRNAFAGPLTMVYQGYASDTGPGTITPWYAMITDGSKGFQLRRGSSQIQFVENATVNSAGVSTDAFNGYGTIMVRNHADAGYDVQTPGSLSTSKLYVPGAVSGTNKLILGGGIGGCCSPGGAQGGAFVAFTWYTADKDDTFFSQNHRAAFGAQAIASGQGAQIGNVGTYRMRYDLDKSGGGLPVLTAGDYLLDPVTGTITNQTFHILGPVNSLDGGTLGGSATWRPHFDRGPAGSWKHQNTAGILSSEDGGLAWMELGSIGGDGGNFVSNAYVIATAFTDAGYTVSNKYTIQNFCPGGIIDGGFDHCEGTVAGAGVFASAPRWGCPMVCTGATGTISSRVYAGNDAGQTAALEIGLIQMTDTLEWQDPSPTNAQVSAQWLTGDAGTYLATGCNAGKVCSIYSMQFSSSWYPQPILQTVSPFFPSTGSYLYDLSDPSSGATHDLLQVVSTDISDDGGTTVPALQGLLYGTDPAYIFPNKFQTGGPFRAAPISFGAGVARISCLEWDVETGILPDGGPGVGSRLVETDDDCADQLSPDSCVDRTIVRQNVAPMQMGLCPGVPTLFEIGTRSGGSSPSTTRVNQQRFCKCSGPKCAGPCR